jgi:diphosphomevalonate decarboxylase
MAQNKSTSIAHPNIAFIKYWGNADHRLRLPSNASISMNLDGLETKTTIGYSNNKNAHSLTINGLQQEPQKIDRLSSYLEMARKLYGFQGFLSVESQNNFPMGAGIASSASAFAALAIVLDDFFALGLDQHQISALARLGSGSACRSIPPGFTEWRKGTSHQQSFAISIAQEDHWDLHDCILVVTAKEKTISSTDGHQRADTSPFQSTRILDAPRRLEICHSAILEKDFEKLAAIIELDSDMMHAVMMTSDPPIHYWQSASLSIMKAVRELRQKGFACAYTLDAGPNVHVICTASSLPAIKDAFRGFPGVEKMLTARTGKGARLI